VPPLFHTVFPIHIKQRGCLVYFERIVNEAVA
jgi:hypothetical protein